MTDAKLLSPYDEENRCWSEPVGEGTFFVCRKYDRPVPNQDPFAMYYQRPSGQLVPWGSHPSDKGARKFFENRIKGGNGEDYASGKTNPWRPFRCSFCDGGSVVTMKHHEDFYNGHADPSFVEEPCEECGGTGLMPD